MLELSPQQQAVLERLRVRSFQFVVFPLQASAIGVQRGNCAALLRPEGSSDLGIVVGPCYLVEGNLSVRIERGGRQWFVWKKKQVEATPERLAELEDFTEELGRLLKAPA